MATYKIRPGDTLSQIAKQHNTTVDALAKANNIRNVNLIRAGATLSIPGAAGAPKEEKKTEKPAYEKNKPVFQQSKGVQDGQKKLADLEAGKPPAYVSAYSSQIDAVLDKILNREAFSYDMNADPLYHQYKNQYTQTGNLAMRDTIGNAAALSGGYGSSYATTAGSQAYDSHLSQLNDRIPELYQLAYGQYRDEGDQMTTQLGALRDADTADYTKYRDTVSDWRSDLEYYYNQYSDMSEAEYNRYLNDLSAWERDREYYYQQAQDRQAQENWEKEMQKR